MVQQLAPYHILGIQEFKEAAIMIVYDPTQDLRLPMPIHERESGSDIRINVAILEDDAVIQERFTNILSDWKSLGRLFNFTDNRALNEQKDWREIDILLADIGLSDGSGINSIVRMSQENPNCLTIVISAMSDATTIMKAIEAGAVGYLHKDDLALGVIASIEQALNGGAPISSAIARKMLQRIDKTNRNLEASDNKNKPGKAKTQPVLQEQLTKRENEVLTILAKGYSYSETAEILNMATSTLPVHVRNIYRKLHANNRTQAISEAKQQGLIN
ncbi:MAG: LuxR C-terminal-related transcriptional regulator [Porticoccaceae bacterium]